MRVWRTAFIERVLVAILVGSCLAGIAVPAGASGETTAAASTPDPCIGRYGQLPAAAGHDPIMNLADGLPAGTYPNLGAAADGLDPHGFCGYPSIGGIPRTRYPLSTCSTAGLPSLSLTESDASTITLEALKLTSPSTSDIYRVMIENASGATRGSSIIIYDPTTPKANVSATVINISTLDDHGKTLPSPNAYVTFQLGTGQSSNSVSFQKNAIVILGSNKGGPSASGVAPEVSRLSSDGANLYLWRLQSCELSIERRYADYYRGRAHDASKIDYDLQIAHAYCHPPVHPKDTDTLAYVAWSRPEPWISNTTEQDQDVNIDIVHHYARYYELLNFCQTVATTAPSPNSKRFLCTAGSPVAALTTFGVSVVATGGLTKTLQAVAVALSALSGGCGSGGGGGGSGNGAGSGGGSGSSSGGSNGNSSQPAVKSTSSKDG